MNDLLELAAKRASLIQDDIDTREKLKKIETELEYTEQSILDLLDNKLRDS